MGTATADVGIRYVRPENFLFGIWGPNFDNPVRGDLQFADIREAGMEALISDPIAMHVNAAIRQNLGFTARIIPDLADGQTWYWPDDEEHFRLNSDGNPYNPTGNGYILNLTHSDHLNNTFASMQEQTVRFAEIPAFRPYIFTNDDYAGLGYGWDYSTAVLADFTSRTGQTAPTAMPTPPTPGAIPDNDNWLTWFDYTMNYVNGGFIRTERAAVTGVRPDIKIGPIPGGMQLPLVNLWEPNQYPTYNFGDLGFNMVSFYDYDDFWMPLLCYTYWTEIGHMGNRQTPEIVVPDCLATPGYSRNNFYNILAGGAKGLEYFTYVSRSYLAWEEFKHLGEVARRIGPVQIAMEPAYRDVALLDSFTSSIYLGGQPTHNKSYALYNLLQAHFSVDIVAETEILQPGFLNNYRGVLLYDIHYLPQSVYTALQNYISGGGLVVLDQSVPFSISGATRVNIDVGEGVTRNQYSETGPSYNSYGLAAGINNVVKATLQPYFEPNGQMYDSSDIKLIATRFQIGEVSYTWFVNVHDHDENDVGRYYWTRDIPVFIPTDESLQELTAWETGRMAAPYSASVTTDTWLGYPYDLVTGSAIDYESAGGGRYLLTWDIERFGGSLVAFYPEPIGTLTLSTNGHAPSGEEFIATATVRGATTGNPMPGMVPVEFTLTDPSQNISPISQVVGTVNGIATLTWTPGINDPQGSGWTIAAKELASNQNTANYVSVSENTPPTVSVSSPTEGYSTTAPATLNITASASDDGIITKVEFYNNGILLGADTSSSGGWTYSWPNVAASGAGGIKLTAKAYDNDNAVTTSAVRSCTVTDSALKLYWKLDQSSGSTAYDTSGNNNNGTLENMNDSDWVSGKILNALDFDKINDRVKRTAHSSINQVNMTKFTISAWIYPRSCGSGNGGRIVCKRHNGYDLYLETSGNKFGAYIPHTTATAIAVSADNAITYNAWQHVALTYNANNDKKVRLYINGNATGTTPAGVGNLSDDSAYNLYVGCFMGSQAFFDGVIDEVRIYNRSLSVTELQALAQGRQ